MWKKKRLHKIVTVDKTRLHFYKSERKLENKAWLTKQIKQPTIAKRGKTIRKALYASFFHYNSAVAQIYSTKAESVTKDVFIHKILSDVQKYCKIGRPKSEMRGIKLLHDTAPVHTAYNKQYDLLGNEIYQLDFSTS